MVKKQPNTNIAIISVTSTINFVEKDGEKLGQKKTALNQCGSTNQVVEGNKIPGNMSERRDNYSLSIQ